MPLRLNLKPYEQIMINGAVITNLRRRAFLAIHNNARIIPGKFVLKQERANTPVRRIYFAAQMMYIFAEDQSECAKWEAEFKTRLAEVMNIVTTDQVREALAEAGELFDQRQFYQALRMLQPVIEYEEQLLRMTGQELEPAFTDGINRPAEDGANHARRNGADRATERANDEAE
jgi:flagellar protein FlbT